ncbi:MAG: zinc ribbon domain-containing protein [Ruminococcus sp.]|nr:zinc ribbon domain-containing protein [Ruminococcus sp.]
MKCPKCGENANKDDRICRNCGTVLKKEKKSLLSLFTGKKNKSAAPSNVPLLETKGGGLDSGKFKYIKNAAVVGAIAVIVILVLVLIFHVASGKGLKQAEKFSGYIGSKVSVAEKELEIHLKDSSSFTSVNKADKFDFIYESEDDISVSDVKFPEWTVTILKTDSEKIDQVIFTDYRVLKKDSRGQKTDKRIDLDKYDTSSKMSTVLDDIDIDPFRITYDVSYIKYEFRYYYKLDNGDVQSVILNVVSNIDNKFMYSISDDVYPVELSIAEPAPRADQ